MSERTRTPGKQDDWEFDAQPGTFLVRVVVRDSEGGQLGATSQTVVVPD